MLTAFTPQPIIELKKRDKSKIESILAYGDRLLVGLSTGALRIYRLYESETVRDGETKSAEESEDTTVSKAVELRSEKENFSRKPVQQLAVIKEANILVALTDGAVSWYDLQTFELTERLEKTRNATCFAVTSNIIKDPKTGIPSLTSRLAVAVRRKLLVWTWHDMEMTRVADEVPVVATVKCLTWVTEHSIVVGMDPGFVLVDVETMDVTDITRDAVAGETAGSRFGAINAPGMGYMGMGNWVPKPLAAKLSTGGVMLAKDVNTLFIDADGKSLEKRQIPWSTAPEAIGYSYPYLLALQPPSKGVLELRNPDTLSLLQSISLPSANLLHVPQPNISLAHAGKGFIVASDRAIWRMNAKEYKSQIQDLIDQLYFDEALSLVGLLEDTLLLDKEEQLREIKTLKALHLFGRQKYQDAMELFAEALAHPRRVLALFPKSVTGDLSKQEIDAKNGEGEAVDANTSVETNDELSPSKASPAKFTSGKQPKPTGDTPTKSKGSHVEGRNGNNNSQAQSLDQQIGGKQYKIAVHQLTGYLAQIRNYYTKYIDYDGKLRQSQEGEVLQEAVRDENSELRKLVLKGLPASDEKLEQELFATATLVYTSLFRSYMLISPSLVGPLVRIDNFCDPDVVKDKLYEEKRYSEIVDFLFNKKRHEQALDMLEKAGKQKKEGRNDDFFGPGRTVAYLQQLPFDSIDLILRYAEWPLEADPDAAMQIFVADTKNAEDLPRDRIVSFLKEHALTRVFQYLEHLVVELEDQTPDFHDELLTYYIDALITGTEITNKEQDQEDGKTNKQTQLEEFLRKSDQYDKYKAINQMLENDPRFFESRAIVWSRLSHHRKALQIYVFQMHNYNKAEEYCNRVFSSLATLNMSVPDPDEPDKAGERSSVYTTLLSLYLDPPSPHEANLEAALQLLSKHGSRVPTLKTLSILPSSLPIEKLQNYFHARMRSATSMAREEAIIAALSKVEGEDVEAALRFGASPNEKTENIARNAGKNRRVRLKEDTMCPVCHARFDRRGRTSAIRVWPDGTVLHYSCSDKWHGKGR